VRSGRWKFTQDKLIDGKGLSAVDLLNKVACFAKKVKAADLN